MRIYLDACVLNRLSDAQTQLRVRIEADAILNIFRLVFLGQVEWVASEPLRLEIARNPNCDKRSDALALLSYASKLIQPNSAVIIRAEYLKSEGYGAYDALHLACAESENAVALLTTDDRFLKQAGRALGDPKIRVLNPVDWLSEVNRGTP